MGKARSQTKISAQSTAEEKEKREQQLQLEKHFQQLQIMGQLRNLEPIIDKVMESKNVQESISVERTSFYKQGVKASDAKYKKLLSEAEQRLRDLEKKQERFIAALLLDNAMGKEKVALLVDVPLQTVEDVAVKITKTHTLLMTNILTWEEIATKLQVSLDFVKTVANAPIGKA